MKAKERTRYAKPAAAILALAMMLSAALADDWPQYLGPTRNSISSQKGILRSWPANGPEVLWTASVGRGFGGPVVKDGKVYLLDRDDKVGDKLRCWDLANGKELWHFAYDAPGSAMFPGSRSVPTVEGNHVYSCGHNGDLYCIDINTHKPVWQKEFGDQTKPPLLHKGCFYAEYGTNDRRDGLVCVSLDGEIKWKTKRSPDFNKGSIRQPLAGPCSSRKSSCATRLTSRLAPPRRGRGRQRRGHGKTHADAPGGRGRARQIVA